MLTVAACGRLSRTAVVNKSVATLRLARSLASRGNLPAPAAGTCRLAGVEPCRGPRRERTELAGYKLYQTAAALAACVPKRKADCEETLRTFIASCIGSGRVSGPNCRAAAAQQIRAGCNRAMTRRTLKTSARTGKKNARDAKKKPRVKKQQKTQKTQRNNKNTCRPPKNVFIRALLVSHKNREI
jgi:hypothetical protein